MILFRKIKFVFTRYSAISAGIILISVLVSGQTPDLRLVAKPYGMVYQSANRYPGSAFLFDDWMPGEIQLKNGQTIQNLMLNYNAWADVMVYAAAGNTPVQLSDYQVKSCLIRSNTGDRSFLVSRNDSTLQSAQENSRFLEVLYNGTNKLYAQRSLRINTTLVKDNPFRKSVYYANDRYLVSIGGKWITRPNKPGSYYDSYEKPVVRKIIRTHKLSLKNEDDLIRFLKELEQYNVMPAEN